MTLPVHGAARTLIGGGGIVALAVFAALFSLLAVSLLGPVKLVFAFGGVVLLFPAFLVRDPRAYGLFFLTFTTPIDVYVHSTKWLASPYELFQEFGMPATGTLGVDFYIADFVLMIMLLPWLAELCRHRRPLHFPKIAYIFVVFLAWSLLVSLLYAPSFYLAIFEWLRQLMYFLFFLYVVNNMVTPAQFRAVILALLAALTIESIIVIVFFQLNIGTELGDLQKLLTGESFKQAGTLPVAEFGSLTGVKRSTGTFAHPAMTAYFLGYILPLALGYLIAARCRRDRLLHGAIFVIGLVAFALTFSRSGVVGLLVTFALFVPLARSSRLISRQAFAWCLFSAGLAAAVLTPLLIYFLASRPQAFAARLVLLEKAQETFWQHPITGAGLNNSSAATEGSHQSISTQQGAAFLVTVVHNHYLIVLIEVGIVGFLLLYGFFTAAAVAAVRRMRQATTEMKLLLVGLVSALAGVAVHNLGDPFGGHMSIAMLWLNAAMICAICHRAQTDPALLARPPTRARDRPLVDQARPAAAQ